MTTAASVAALRDAYPRQDFPDRSVSLYVRMLRDIEGGDLAAAVTRLIRRSPFLPSIAEIRMEVAEARTQLPTAAEAWSMVTQMPNLNERANNLPNVVRQSLDAMGGSWSIRRSERPETLRAQFMRDYEQRRHAKILAVAGASARPELVERDRVAIAATPIPETTSALPRPVWGRWLRRQSFTPYTDGPMPAERMPPPTDAEKHDAIAVLEAGGWGVQPLFDEAQRILDEASAA
jgi:hypothetical protein